MKGAAAAGGWGRLATKVEMGGKQVQSQAHKLYSQSPEGNETLGLSAGLWMLVRWIHVKGPR